jgi:hypothetical protein
MIGKIVSGGQTGADRAALDWAIENGIPHGGWCPKGRLWLFLPRWVNGAYLRLKLVIYGCKASGDQVMPLCWSW